MSRSKSEFVELFESSPLAVESAVMKLYERQTAQEQQAKQTIHKNFIGFSAADAKLLSRAGKWVKWNRQKSGSSKVYMDPAIREQVKARLPRYHKQLNEILAAKS